MGKHQFYNAVWSFRHVRKGKVIWEEEKRNALVDQGESSMLDTFFRGLNVPSEFYIRLARSTILDTSVLNDIANEPSGNGYAAALIERSAVGFDTLELDEGDYRVISKEVSFTASGGDIGPISVAFLSTTSDNLGLLLAFVNLSLERTILDGDSVYCRMRIKLQ